MIISASRRTDIPTNYSDWFFNRIKEGHVLVRNPMNYHQVSRVDLSPDAVDGIVFWTKNPLPMLSKLNKLRDYMYYFQFTINSYGVDVEPNVPSKNDVIIPAFQNLSDLIGPDRVIWRYDPIFLNEKYTINHHIEFFEKLAKRLCGYTKKCIFSYMDFYNSTKNNIRSLRVEGFDENKKVQIARSFSQIARSYNLKIDTCAEDIDLSEFGIGHARCIDDQLFELLLNSPLKIEKDRNQRFECGCVASIDIGMYNSCLNGCQYCYANHSKKTVDKNHALHDQVFPLLFGEIGASDIIKERKVTSCRECQKSLFS